MYKKIQETASWLKERMTTSPKTAIILGTGLGQLASEITETYEFPYAEIPNFPVSTVEGLYELTTFHPPFDMVITVHINNFPEHPLRGKNFPTGPRFPDMHETYDKQLVALADKIAEEKGIRIKHGIYMGVQGPTFETPAEYKLYYIMGADAVGMSTVPEVIVAHHCGIKTFGISIITDLAIAGEVPVEVSHEEVQIAANNAQPKMTEIMREMIKRS